MTFNEKSAWLMSIALLVAGGSYFATVLNLSQASGTVVDPSVPLLIKFTVVVVAIAIAGHVLIAWLRPDEADDTLDEREKQIVDIAGNWAGYVLGAGAVTGLLHFLVLGDGNLMFYIIFGSLIIAQLADYVLRIVMLRRGF